MSPLAVTVVRGAVGKVTELRRGGVHQSSENEEQGRRRALTVFVERGVIHHLSTILEERLTELLRENVGGTSLDWTVVNVVLHVVELRENGGMEKLISVQICAIETRGTHQSRISTIHNDDTASSDISINGSESTKSRRERDR